MKILLVGTIKRRIGQEISASRSSIIFQLGKHLALRGHQVCLLGTKDSQIPGVTTHAVIEKGFVDLPPFENQLYGELSYLVALEKEIEMIAGDFDMIHNHSYPEFVNLYATERVKTPIVTTLHAQGTTEYDQVLSLFSRANLVSISKAHRKLFKKSNPRWVVYNGIDTNLYKPGTKKENYLLWLGRLGKAKNSDGSFFDAKGIRWAIELARKTGERLIVSGNIEDMGFYEKDVKPYLGDKIVWYGPLSSEQKLRREEIIDLMQKAKAFLMTINWEEPFGLVMIEAMACGTPVVAFARGSVPEIVKDGETGFIINPSDDDVRGDWIIKKTGFEGLCEAVNKLYSLSQEEYKQMRLACRKRVEERFTIEKMVEEYEKVYQDVLNSH